MNAPVFHRWFNYDRRLLPNPFLAELEEGVSTIDEARNRTGLSIGYPGWGVIYYATACALDPTKPATILETGTNWGCSTIVLASVLKDAGLAGVVHTVEIDPANAAKARDNFKRAGLADRIVLHEGDSRNVLRALIPTLEEVSVAFLDGGHQFELVKAEFELVLPKLARRGVALFDNTYEIAQGTADERVYGFLKWLPCKRTAS